MIIHPTHTTGSALRERMSEDMAVRGFTEATRRDNIRFVEGVCCLPGPLARHRDG